MFTELHPYYTYEIVVAAVTVAVGPYSIPVQITTPEDSKSSIWTFCAKLSDIESYCSQDSSISATVTVVLVLMTMKVVSC